MPNASAADNFIQNRVGRLDIPTKGQVLTVTLPGEILRAEVVEVVDQDHIVCQIGQPMSKSHNYRLDQKLSFHRERGLMREFWEAD